MQASSWAVPAFLPRALPPSCCPWPVSSLGSSKTAPECLPTQLGGSVSPRCFQPTPQIAMWKCHRLGSPSRLWCPSRPPSAPPALLGCKGFSHLLQKAGCKADAQVQPTSSEFTFLWKAKCFQNLIFKSIQILGKHRLVLNSIIWNLQPCICTPRVLLLALLTPIYSLSCMNFAWEFWKPF